MSYQVMYNIVYYYVDCGLWAVGRVGSVCRWWLGGIGEPREAWLPYFTLLPSSCDRSSGWLAEKPEKGTKRRPDGRTATTAENAAARPSGHP